MTIKRKKRSEMTIKHKEIFDMDLKELLGDAYKDGMTVEEINAALAEKKFIDKAAFDKLASDHAKANKALKDKMTEDEAKIAKEQEILSELETLRQERAKSQYEASLAKGGYSEKDIAALVNVMGDPIKTAAELARIRTATIDETSKSVKAELLKTTTITPPPADPQSSGEITKEKFATMGYEARVKLASENPTLYAELSK